MTIKHDLDPNVNGWSIIIPTRKTSRNLKRFLESIEYNSYFKHEIIIICDLFTSWQTYKFLQERKMWYYQVNNCNYYANCNFGVSKATREYVVLSQDDTIFNKNWDKNINVYLDHKTYITPVMIQGWQINNYFGMDNKKGKIEDFNFDLFNDYCQKNSVNEIKPNWKMDHPIIMAKDLFERVGGFATYTVQERRHIHHEVGLEARAAREGAKVVGCRNSFIYHAPWTGTDKITWDYGYRFNQGRQNENTDFVHDAHYPVKCNKCGIERPGYLLTNEELKRVEEYLEWLCENCK